MTETYYLLCNAFDAKLDTVLRENNYYPEMDFRKLKSIEEKYIALCGNIILEKLNNTVFTLKEKQQIERLVQLEIIKNLKKEKWIRYYELNKGIRR